jgi:hypothetical protein
MKDLIDTVFTDADEAHKAHLLTTSFAAHAALGEFYPAVRVALDAFVEAAIALDAALDPEDMPADRAETLEMLETSYVELLDKREGVCQENPTLLTLHDEITAVYLKAIFSLKRLS